MTMQNSSITLGSSVQSLSLVVSPVGISLGPRASLGGTSDLSVYEWLGESGLPWVESR